MWAEVTQNRIIALVLAMIVAVPLLAAPADRNLTGIAAITLESFALLLMTALLWRAKWDLRAENVQRFLKTGANLPIVLLFGLMTLSCVFSPSKLFSIQELLRTGAGILLYFVVAYQFRQSKHLSLLVSVVLALSAIVALGGMAQYQLFAEDRASALFGNAQPLASFVMLLLPIVAALAWTDKSPNRRIAAMIVSVLMVACLMLTQGRSAWAGAAVGLLLLAYLATRPVGPQVKSATVPLRARKHQFVWPVAVAIIAVGFLAITKSQNTTIDSRAVASSNLAADGSWQSRLQSWKGTVQMIEARPLAGWGIGLYPVYQRQFTGQGAVIPSNGLGIRVSLAEQAHNFYLQTAAELGVPGLLLTLATFVCFLNAGLRRMKQLEPGIRRTLLMGSLAATAAFLVDAAASPSWQYGQTAMFLWLIMGVGTSCLRPRVRREEIVEVHMPSRRFTLISRPLAVGLFLVLVALLPTGFASAQSSSYNGSNAAGTAAAIAGGAGLLYFISQVSEDVAGGAAGAGADAGAGGSAASSSAPGSGGFSGTTGSSATGSETAGAGTGDSGVIGVAPTPTPTPTPAPVLIN
ncbi:hypothetical protein IAD21_00413 [Abditibacteriota bacterium]|nr:hypothetical protein IAD21_00413 [Abditibacteriota bacterium]